MSPSASPTILWFRQDLRLGDHPALHAAVKRGQPIIPVYIHARHESGRWELGGACNVWLHHALEALNESLIACGSQLVLRSGSSLEQLTSLIQETQADAVYWTRRYEPTSIAVDEQIKAALKQRALEAKSFEGRLLCEPWDIVNKQGKPYRVFTPYWRTVQQLPEPASPLSTPQQLPVPIRWPANVSLSSFKLLPKIPWDAGIRKVWRVSEAGAQEALDRFLAEALNEYQTGRDRPDMPYTSRLSPYLQHGQISPRQIWHAVRKAMASNKKVDQNSAWHFLRELGWREFSYHLLYHEPQTPEKPLQEKFKHFQWREDSQARKAWQKGETGYPIVDAGMRQLWRIGWMHNRVRMIVASFLVKDLRIRWQCGAEWFWDTLVDADLANNTMGWQWAGGCGADAAPYFRVFNPVLQGKKFDPEGAYVRQWVPELAAMPAKHIHAPWETPEKVLKQAGVRLGQTYPHPIVDHGEARDAALQAFEKVKRL